MINPVKTGMMPLANKTIQNRDSETKTESSASSSRAQSIKESLQKGEYKINLSATSEKMALNLLNRG
ncbi:MAG: flagellar biosynthesis anti-sigma factor FlgM [Wolinella sp.]